MNAARLRIFISSVQNEFKKERQDVKAFLLGDAFLRHFVSEVFLFEDIPAKDQHVDEIYLDEVEKSDLYIGIFGYEYGSKDENGISPTEYEFDHATKCKRTRLIYVWGSEETKRSLEMKNLIRKASDELVRRRVENMSALTSEVYASIIDYLNNLGMLRLPPFDAAICSHADLSQVSKNRVDWFVETARKERGFPLKTSIQVKSLLIHLNLIENDKPLNAAIILFGKNPQHFYRTAETKCIHCHGTEYLRPFASQQIYKSDIFEQVDQARDFVLSKISRSVGTRTMSAAAPVRYELPPDAVGEAIVNAIAHRDYYSNGSVEVRLFADRLEIWNPGLLPRNITPDTLRKDHSSVPNNPLIAESMYLTRYIEKTGSGTQMMIKVCIEANLPEPDFEEREGFFVVTLWRDWLTRDVLTRIDLIDRQRKAIEYLKCNSRISNSEYQKNMEVSKATATRDLEHLQKLKIIKKVGTTGKGTFYVIQKKGLIKDSNGS